MSGKIITEGKRFIAFALCLLIVLSLCSSAATVSAADGTITFDPGANIPYGTYSTTRMTFDGTNTAYCLEPSKKTPSAGSYQYNFLPESSPIRKGLYYLNGGYGYEKTIKNQYFGGWSDTDSYVIGHLTLAYIFDNYNENGNAFYGAPANFKNKAKEMASVINSLPAPPRSFRAFILPIDSRQTVAGSWFEAPYGWIEIQKSSANGSISSGNTNYSLEGAKYGIYQGSTHIATITTDRNGYGKSGDLEEGDYVVREIQASAGYAVDTSSYNVTVQSDLTSDLSVQEIPQNNPLDLLIQKIDAETRQPVAQTTGSLENAQFTVKYYKEQMDTDPANAGKAPAKTWVFKTDKEGQVYFTKNYRVSGDEFYYQLDGTTPCMPLGTVTIQETKAPEGYLLNKEVQVHKISGSGRQETVSCYHTATVEEQPYRGDLEFVKVSDGDLQRLADVPFSITSKTTKESHIIVTDQNGYASTAASWVKHTANTNQGTSSSDGIWFGTSRPDDSRGALLYDTYIVEEQRCEANQNKNLLKFEVTVYKDSVTVQLGTLTNDSIDIETTALDKKTGSHLAKPEETVTLIDTVEYEGLKKGQEYKIVGTLMDKETGEPILINGREVKAEKSFQAKKASGRAEVTFTFNGVSLAGKTVVIFEELYQEDQKLAVHADIEDENQTIHFPDIGTTARDDDTDDRIANADKEVTLIDTVNYHNLISGEEYKVTGTLMDRETKKVIEKNGNPVTAETTFVPVEADGTVNVIFKFDGRELEGRTVVAFESMTYNGKELAVHADLAYEGQTIYFPEIGTTAVDSETKDHIGMADEAVTVVDTVKYENLIAGKEYKVSGMLMDRETGKELLVKGQKVTAETIFIPEESQGSVEVIFTFDGRTLQGKTVVAFETLTYQNKKIASHTEIEDEEQTVYFPKIGTSAADSETQKHIAAADEEVRIIDTVGYENLIPGKKYKVTGVLMDKETGVELLVGNQRVTAETVFVPEKSKGSVEVVFTFDGSELQGKTVVAFEKVIYQEKEIAIHAEIGDEGQTIYFPEIGTTAKDSDTKENISNADEEVTLVDTVRYKNLIAGEEYTISGSLIDKKTEKSIKVDGKHVTAETVFVPTKASGTVDVTFVFDGTALKGKTVVVFETLTLGGKELAVHADLGDEGQTIHFPKIGTTAIDSDTADHIAKADGEVTIVDTVKYKNLVPGKEYQVTGVLMDKKTGKRLLINGRKVKAKTVFVPEKSKGSVEVVFTFDGSALKGRTVVAFETLTYQGKEVASHTEIKDKKQTIHFPEIGTKATDSETEHHIAAADEEVTLIDIVEYKNLIPEKEYKITGILMDKETGEELLINDQKVMSETVFTPKKPKGTVEMEFTFDGSELRGKTVVVFETVTYHDKQVAVHTEIKEEEQTVYFPEIRTKAEDLETADHISKADEEVTLIDAVEYKNLIPGEEYKVTGTLMDQETGEAVEIEGKPVISETVFIPEETSGTVDVTFVLNGTELKGKTVVVFETMTFREKTLAIHADLEDKGQTIHFPEIGTTATGFETGCHLAKADEEVKVIDKVQYENLIPGKEYKVSGVLMDKETGEELLVNDQKVTSETIFVPEETSGFVELEFTFNGSILKGGAVVAFETVTYQEKEVASHTEIDDEDQTVYLPEIHTMAKDGKDGGKELLIGDTLTIVDTVDYRKLEIGQEYTIVGMLMDKTTGKALEMEGQPVTSEVIFSAEEADGTIDVSFSFSGVALANHELVVFEKLYLNKKDGRIEIANHEDMEDEGQTVKIVTQESPKTGDNVNVWLWILLAGAALGEMAVIGICKAKKRKGQKGN